MYVHLEVKFPLNNRDVIDIRDVLYDRGVLNNRGVLDITTCQSLSVLCFTSLRAVVLYMGYYYWSEHCSRRACPKGIPSMD